MPAWGQSYYVRALILDADKPRIVMMLIMMMMKRMLMVMMMMIMIRIQDYEEDERPD